MSYFFDTDVIIDYLKGVDKSLNLIDDILEKGKDIYISVIVVAELYSVNLKPSDKKTLINLFNSIEIIPINYQLAIKSGELRAKYHRGLADCLIAASVKELKSTLITRNKKDYELMGLKVITPF